jgi:mRNA degradation ribonuclease J1/J2
MSSEMTTRTGITFYGGVGEMGGNKFLVEDDDTKIFLDFGMDSQREGNSTLNHGFLPEMS